MTVESKHTPAPWTFKNRSGAGLEIYGDISKCFGEKFSKDFPIFGVKGFPPNIQIAYETWVQFPDEPWNEMQAANAALIVRAVNNFGPLVEALEAALSVMNNECDPDEYAGPFTKIRAALTAAKE